MSLTSEAIDHLKAPFSDDKISVKVQCLNRERSRAMLVKYVPHIDVADRLDEVDPHWSNEIIKDGSAQVGGENAVYTHMKLTILGVSRENVGEGQDPKSSASDALKRCASSFGVCRNLYDDARKSWVDYNEETDKYRVWTMEDYERGLQGAGLPTAPPPSGRKPPVTPKKGAAPAEKPASLPSTKPALWGEIRRCARLADYSEVDLRSWARDSAGVSADKMDVPQLQKFIGELHFDMRKAGIQV